MNQTFTVYRRYIIGENFLHYSKPKNRTRETLRVGVSFSVSGVFLFSEHTLRPGGRYGYLGAEKMMEIFGCTDHTSCRDFFLCIFGKFIDFSNGVHVSSFMGNFFKEFIF